LPIVVGFHESHGPSEAFGGKAGKEDVVFEDEDAFGAGGEAGAEAGHVGFENSAFAVGGMLIDEGDLDEIAETDTLELGPSGFVSVGAVSQGDAIDAVEGTPIFCQRVFVWRSFCRVRDCRRHRSCLALWRAF